MGGLQLQAPHQTLARSGREGDALARWDRAARTARRLPFGYAHSRSMFSGANVELHASCLTVGLWKRNPGPTALLSGWGLHRASLFLGSSGHAPEFNPGVHAAGGQCFSGKTARTAGFGRKTAHTPV